MTERKVKLDRANKSILLRALGWQKQPSTNCAPSAWLRAGTPMPWMMPSRGCSTPTRRCCSGEEDAELAREHSYDER